MVSTVDGYDYVIGADVDAEHPHGDMDRIIIDGDIMPKRKDTYSATTGVERKRILRGEDVCFLMEWERQRLAAVDEYAYFVTDSDGETSEKTEAPPDYDRDHWKSDVFYQFTRKIDAGNSYKQGLWSSVGDLAFVDEAQLSGAKAFARSSSEGSMSAAEVLAEYPVSRIADAPALSHGDALDLSKMEAFFSLASSFQDKGVFSRYGFAAYGAVPYAYESYYDGTLRPGYPTEGADILSDGKWFLSDGVYGYSWANTMKSVGIPKSGQRLFRLHAPHAAKVVLVLQFLVEGKSGGGYASVLVPKEASAAGNGRFDLMSDDFASESFFDEVEALANGAGVVTSYSDSRGAKRRVAIEGLYAFPVVFFDDHTRI